MPFTERPIRPIRSRVLFTRALPEPVIMSSMGNTEVPEDAELTLFSRSVIFILSLFCGIFSSGTAVAWTQSDIDHTATGALLTLLDSQIMPRTGLGSPRFDYCGTGFGCRSTQIAVLPLLHSSVEIPIAFPFPAVRNMSGEWYNSIHALPGLFQDPEGRAPVAIQDSNLFMTANIAWSLLFARLHPLPGSAQISSLMLDAAMANILSYQRGSGFHFWPKQPSAGRVRYTRTGPLNLPVAAARLHRLSRFFPGMPEGPISPWFEAVFDPQLNPTGAEALTNIPNDADDTALAAAVLSVSGGEPEMGQIADEALTEIFRWRDVSRSREDGRDSWKGKDSGGFLTWLHDEDAPWFEDPGQGVLPLGVNNVDCVVNANVLLAAGLSGKGSDPEILKVSSLLNEAVRLKAWPACGLYYPQLMMFPYALSRAWRDGDIRHEALREAGRLLLADILAIQKSDGSFPGDPDVTRHLSTALGLSTMLNLGLSTARDAGLEKVYREAVYQAADFIIRAGQKRGFRYFSTKSFAKNLFGSLDHTPLTWTDGVFFSASRWSLAQWRSEAFTVAKVLEALLKLRAGYESESVRLLGGSNRW